MFKNDANYLDQHFLIDENIIKKYVSFPKFDKTDVVLEIGPGKGTLTRIITPKVGKMYAIELDKRLKPYLEEIPNLNIIWGSVLDVEIPEVDKIITSLPYSIIEPFIYKMIKTNFQEMYMLMGDKYILNVVNKEITKLSVVTNSFFKTEILLEVPPVAFDIQPRTDSYIVKMVKVEVPKEKKYQLYREIYLLDEKKIRNSLMEALIKLNNLTKKEAKELIKSLNIPEKILEEKFETLSNKDLKILDIALEKLENYQKSKKSNKKARKNLLFFKNNYTIILRWKFCTHSAIG